MGITPVDFEILGCVLQQGAAAERTLAFKYPPQAVRKLIDEGYLVKFGKGFLGLSKRGRKAVTLGVVP
jgi:hypothetical protein